ncbi:MAG TPA: hypothetical protein VK400_20400, partial [Pyrinomonadaceae bacterium]|nr:hypothetical protein [Pyrinomonadaceae bacterium]
ASLKNRVVSAEQNGYLVQESQVVNAINWMADEFSAPSYAKTSSLQIRATRVTLNQFMPNLFVNKDNQGNISVNRQVNSTMSDSLPPAQATCLLLVVVQQKMLNQYFQKTPADWEANFLAEQEAAAGNDSPNAQSSPQIETRSVQAKSIEMQQLVFNSNFAQPDVERLAQGVLDKLGIPR